MLIIADNQTLTRAGLLHLFQGADCRVAASRQELMRQLSVFPDATVILDYSLFDFHGLEQFLIYVRRFPSARWLLTQSEFHVDLLRLLGSEETISLIQKEADADEWDAAAAALRERRRYHSPFVKEQLKATTRGTAYGTLTQTETDVLTLIAQGLTAREIAERRHSSIHTIVTHKKNIFRKLSVSTAYEATRYAMRAGLVDLVEYYI